MNAGLGVVLRDNDGLVVADKSSVASNVSCVFSAEGQALTLGLEVAVELGCTKIIIETGAIQLYDLFVARRKWNKVHGTCFLKQ